MPQPLAIAETYQNIPNTAKHQPKKDTQSPLQTSPHIKNINKDTTLPPTYTPKKQLQPSSLHTSCNFQKN